MSKKRASLLSRGEVYKAGVETVKMKRMMMEDELQVEKISILLSCSPSSGRSAAEGRWSKETSQTVLTNFARDSSYDTEIEVQIPHSRFDETQRMTRYFVRYPRTDVEIEAWRSIVFIPFSCYPLLPTNRQRSLSL